MNIPHSRAFEVIILGTLSYEDAYQHQTETLESVRLGQRPDTVLLVEHPPVLTLGANFHAENLVLDAATYASHGIAVHSTDRGGDVTYHGPGQLVAYPIFSLETRGKDLHRYLRDLEEAVIRTLAHFGVEGRRFSPHTGVWVAEEKICAMGIKVRKWVTMHGLALNCDVDLAPFELIIPCGIRGYGVTSLSKELGRQVTVAEVQPVLLDCLSEVFGP